MPEKGLSTPKKTHNNAQNGNLDLYFVQFHFAFIVIQLKCLNLMFFADFLLANKNFVMKNS